MEKGMLHIYFGDGKGKTSAALGLAMRASGRGKRVLLCRFLKADDSGELIAAQRLSHFDAIESPPTFKFTFEMDQNELDQTAELCNSLLISAAELSSGYDMLILDEVLCALSAGLLGEEPLLQFLRARNEHLEIILTGDRPSENLLEMADYVSEIKKIKHPFDRGVAAREGIEF